MKHIGSTNINALLRKCFKQTSKGLILCFCSELLFMKKFLLFVVMMLPAAAIWAQCAVCTKTASTLDDQSARGLNGGILYLALLPLALIATIGIIWKRYQRES